MQSDAKKAGGGRVRFSEKLAGMKFMQRGEETKTRTRLERDEKRQLKEWQWVVEGHGGEGEARKAPAVALDEEDGGEVAREEARRKFVPGRRSYGNFNPKVDRAMKEVKASAAEAAADADTLADEEMAEHFRHAHAPPGAAGGGAPKRSREERARDFLKKSKGAKRKKKRRTGE